LVTPLQWVVAIGASLVVIAGGVVTGVTLKRPAYRAALLGIATGASLGFTSSLLKAVTVVFAQSGVAATLGAWQLWLALAWGGGTFGLLQLTLRSGRLVASQPGITLADPLVAIAWGGLAYGENMNGGLAIIGTLLAACCLVGGAVLLAKAPALEA